MRIDRHKSGAKMAAIRTSALYLSCLVVMNATAANAGSSLSSPQLGPSVSLYVHELGLVRAAGDHLRGVPFITKVDEACCPAGYPWYRQSTNTCWSTEDDCHNTNGGGWYCHQVQQC